VASRRRFIELAGIALVQTVGSFLPESDRMDGSRAGEQRTFGGVRVRWCPQGRFVMGSPPSEPDRRGDEAQVEVTFTRGFWMGQFEITQGQWRRVMGRPTARPLSAEYGLGDDVPVYWVSFLDAEAFCAALTASTRLRGEVHGSWEFRVPTEAQWEYAARAGTTTATAFGDAFGPGQANFNGVLIGGGAAGPAPGRAVAAGSYPANAWGLHDMHGNVFEWCRDYYHDRLPGGADPDLRDVKGTPNRDGTYSRVRRGGAWNDEGKWLRSAVRFRYEPERSSDHIGFRVVLVRP
jgi:sulfatase modifying factor 1